MRQLYPAGLHRKDHWLLAELEIGKRLKEGIEAPQLIAAAEDYAELCSVESIVGTGKVLRPNNFYNGSGAHLGPFPIPKAHGQQHLEAAHRAIQEWRAHDPASDAGSASGGTM